MSDAQEAIDYRSLFRSVPTAFVVLDPDLVIVDANDAYLAATMRSRQSLVGRPVFEAFPDNPDDPAASGVTMWGASLRRVLRERVTDVMAIQKYDIPQPGGGFETRYWAPVNAPVFGADGELRYLVHRTEDVTGYVRARQDGADMQELADELRVRTEQMEAEVFARRRLQQRNESMQALIDSLESAVVGCAADGRPVLSNDAARGLFGDDLADVPVQQWPQRLPWYDLDRRPLPVEELPLVRALRGEHIRGAEVLVQPPGEPERVFRVHGRPVVGRSELAAVVAMHDITGPRRAARVQACELEVSKIVAAPQPADVVLARAVEVVGTMLGWAAAEFWGVDDVARVLRREACWAPAGRHAPCHLPDPLRYGQGLPGHAWQTGTPVWAGDLRRDTGDAGRSGDPGPLRAALAVPIPSGSVVLGVLVCYSDTPQVADDTRAAVLTGVGAHIGEFLTRRRAQRLTAELDRTRDEYIALVGHELRTPLTTIQSYTDLMLDEPDLPGEHRDMLTAMQRNTAGLHAIVAKLLDVAGMRSGLVTLCHQPMDLAAVVHDAVDAARAGGVRIDAHTPDRTAIDGDPQRLRQVLDELLGNASTWTAGDAPVVVDLRADARSATLTVANTGTRIPSGEHARLFELFFRGGAARHRGVPGSGLGLTLVRAIVEQHGGTVTVGDPGEPTTTFTVRLPTELPASQTPAGEPASRSASAVSGPRWPPADRET